MEWVRKLYGKTVGLDSAPLVYFVEAHPKYLPIIRPFFQAVESGRIQVVTSTITLTEVLVHPLRQQNFTLALEYSDILLNSPHFTTYPVAPVIASKAAEIRAVQNLKTPDAIQLAAAQLANATAFLTNDREFTRSSSLQVLIMDELLAVQHP